ncbi:M4 family peptidase [Streptomyces griseoviridis]|uniref:M4 family peptidase n=2 Tax=Streptomyces TaxID=1883 RepID=A0A3S9Z633_STRGD|nr:MULTISPECIES: M4 family metallopeptidase [Streptomyces]AZS83221.1 M4 family peptidase [Streptomyces griseoviridis]MDT0477626.1 M4 family metallopeptidase [Streptomyces sp. DSM 41014]QCN89925.1 peptidase M4 [Streptomyces griseoviridis]
MSRQHRSSHRSRYALTLALTAVGTLLATGVQTGTAGAAPAARDTIHATPRAGAAPAGLTPARRAALLKGATAKAAATAAGLGLGAKEKLVVKDVAQDADGTTHTRYERTYAGLPVLGGDLVVHAKDGRITTSEATDATVTVPTLTPKVTSATARGKALAAAKKADAKGAAIDTAPRLVVWAGDADRPTLAWESVVGGLQHDDTPSELHVVTDAATGKELFRFEGVQTGTGTGQFSGTVPLSTTLSGSTYQLVDGDRAGHRTYDLNQGTSGTGTLFTDDNDVWGDGTQSNRQTAGVDVAFGAAATWDYYKDVFGRNGIRNDGVAAYSRAHYGNNYVNAFWSDSCFCMTYGDGSGNTHPLTALDVAAHEMSHGVTSATAGLTYSGESGGLNEATSDIFAAAVEFHADLPADVPDYFVGEKININGNGTPLRYMDKPSRDGTSRDSWDSSLGGIDVHYSSGPANHFFYLLSEGSGAKTVNGVAYDSPTSDGLPVTGIGIENAQQIWYRALTTYMTSSTNYAGARTATLQAAADLFGAYTPTYLAVSDAWAAINVGQRIAPGVNIAATANQTSGVGDAVSLQVEAYTTNTGSALTYSATGLPDGLTIDASGLITGTPTTAATSTVAVTVADATGSTATRTFTWRVAHLYANSTRIDIPDAGAAVESPVTVSGRTGNASATTEVYVKIVHTYRGDLTVDLVGPNGTVYSLLNRSGGSADNVDQTFTVDASAQPVEGTWKLRVQDRASIDVGYLEKWYLAP